MSVGQQAPAMSNATEAQLELEGNLLSLGVSQTKLIASLILFLATLLCGYLPVKVLLNQDYIQYAMFAGGGVLMATAFCHLIPEAHDNFKAATESSNHLTSVLELTNQPTMVLEHASNISLVSPEDLTAAAGGDQPTTAAEIPYLEITLCCGFFFMYFVEQLMVRFVNNHSHGHTACEDVTESTSVNLSSINSINTTSVFVNDCSNDLSASGSTNPTTGHNHQQHHQGSNRNTEFYKFMRGLLIVSAFGAHSIFDGVAIGSQITNEKVWTTFLAISCHKFIIAAVIGLELYIATLESHLWTLVHLFIFSIMSPIGIILVVIAQESLHINSNHPTMILLQSFATGTLLYIVFVEILQPKETQKNEVNKFGKGFSLVTGFALMIVVLTLFSE